MLTILGNWALDKFRPMLRKHRIGRHTIRLPKRSQLKNYQRYCARYDFQLGPIADTIAAKYPDFCAIDVGANVGDTAAIICRERNVPVLCIEGDTTLLPLLRANARQIGSQIIIEAAFVGAEGDRASLDTIRQPGLNATLAPTQGDHRLQTLREIIDRHPQFREAKLLKIDAEGYDFRIIEGSLPLLASAKPVIFFEYDPTFHAPNFRAGLGTIQTLLDLGYVRMIVYANQGHFMLSLNEAGMIDHFAELNGFLRSNRRYGGAVAYLDICAFHAQDADLAAAIREAEIKAVLDPEHDGGEMRWIPPSPVIWRF